MDLTCRFYLSCVVVLAVYMETCHTITVTVTKSPDRMTLGDNAFTLGCQYTLNQGETPTVLLMKRKRADETDYTPIASLFPPTLSINASFQDATLESRVTLFNPTAQDTVGKLEFSTIVCDDEATYMCEVTYYTSTQVSASATESVLVKTVETFPDADPLPFSPSLLDTELAEGDEVTFTCAGDVGRNPDGTFGWYTYLDGAQTNGLDVTNLANIGDLVYQPSTCSNTRLSTLRLTLEKSQNNFVVRCTVKQTDFTENGNGHRQTDPIPVKYAPTIDVITKSPDHGEYTIGANVQLTCTASGNPAPNIYWEHENGTVVNATQLQLANEALGQTTYTCFARNNFKGVNHTVSQNVTITVVATTTTTTTTTPTPSSTDPNRSTPTQLPITDEKDDATVYIVVGVLAGVVVIVIIIIVLYCCVFKKRKRPEIEEPPKINPRNNQGLSYYGNRPDLVTDDKMKNSRQGLNTSFNNSFDSSDSKPRNDDALNYIDLTFDDQPRSRKPIQILDNGGTPYADIAMPQV